MTLEKILIVDDEGGVRGVLVDLLREEGLNVLAVASLSQAREIVGREEFDFVLSDVRLGDGDGLDFLLELKERVPGQKVAIMTGYASLDSAVKAIRLGVQDYLIKPIDPALLKALVKRLDETMRLEEENRYLRKEIAGLDSREMIQGESEGMRGVLEMIGKVGETEATVLIQGESGTGKEVVARAVYEASARREKPFVKVNCAAVPATLMESEFFGHEKGAFTGAVQRRSGRFELADGGTLLLDEITEIPPELQVKLLRVLQEREFERVGGNKTIRVDVRILATTNRDLKKEVKAGTFREDLFYRLNVFPIVIPPLRERGEDILILAETFLRQFAKRHGKSVRGFSAETKSKLKGYGWPGNVRELQNVIERAVILSGAKTKLDSEDLWIPAGKVKESAGSVVTLAEMEREMIERALRACNDNRTHAAKMLGVSLRTLRNRLREYRMEEG